jgi:two-component system NtrC family sensor kinase
MPGEPDVPGRRPLRRGVLLAFVPLACALVAASVAQWNYARAVHGDIERLFEELREVAVVRALIDELRGVEQWVAAPPPTTEEAAAFVRRDVDQHLAAALATVKRFQPENDPSRPDHESQEGRLVELLRRELQAMADATGGRLALAGLREPLASCRHAAASLAAAIESESRDIGDDLDRGSDAMRQLLLLLGGAGLLTLGLLGWSLLRRVLQPVDDLRDAAVRLGGGDLAVEIPRHRDDELGDLAGAFRAMARQLRANRDELEARVVARTQEALRSARLAQLGTLAAGVAHEINNPLASIVAAADGLLRGVRNDPQADPQVVEYLHILRKEALRAKDITTRLLRFARHDPSRRAPIRLADEVREVAAFLAHQLQQAGLSLQVEVTAADAVIEGDAEEWRQALLNLLRNAMDASPSGGVIRLTLALADGGLRLVVADDGPGIPADLRQQVFEPFFTTKPTGQGTGLGLAITHRIVTSHGGRIHVADAPGGARIVIDLPLAAAPATQ